jgi:tetratricopeptide (TPR) repeat protein
VIGQRRDWRGPGLALTLAVVLAGGAWLARLGPAHAPEVAAPAPVAAAPASPSDLTQRFDAAVALLRSRQYAAAVAALHQVIERAPQLPEAHVNMGYALLGLQRPALARQAFDRATALRPQQANAYYGLALASEAEGDLEMALGAMRSYLHLARSEDEAHLRRARAALWEWETRLAEVRTAAPPKR